ncbi:hypothetical protein P170DRAFT_506183 [Aspergillus steynii IBT 23096]|uniref:Mediator of RNA polymerase II transcription subunit 13 n=1 Tax=Aspergillus steynii IBT 23096 TaxID=1392250 RepID=A0A2I2GRW2_9EURO|nr:uncharacterized protein P170DRAFT_506183 [Aspergillus steynii IBT 23096]PLB55627.1 hypothetical protein P170DRAFT_506183 [Aspergillus steynii IBT 23096]
MDFPGGSITNIRVIDGFSNIYWRIYTEEPNITNLPGEAPANGYTILKHLSRLKDLELRLRNLDCLVSSYPRRLGLWVFSATPDFEGLGPLCSHGVKDEQSRLVVGASTLKVSASGNITSWDIVKNLSSDPQNASGNPAGPQRQQNTAGTPTRRMDGYSSSATIYASFISAVTGALNLQLIRRNKVIPLGSRSLFTNVDRECYENLKTTNNDPSSFSALTTLQVQLTSAGKLTVTLQTISQPGILRLHQPGDHLTALQNVPSGVDVWLSPSGSVARLVTTNPGPTDAFSPYPSGEGVAIDGNDTAQRKQWKLTVLEWLKNFGLAVDSVEETTWVEVEVWEPFYSRLAGETLRPKEENTFSLPLKRILWPAVFCFRRARSATSEPVQTDSPMSEDPLDFAQKWRATDIPENSDANPKLPPNQQEPRAKDQDMPLAGSADLPEGFESLSRASQYPELQTASLVYPTPPDGAVGMGLNSAAPPSDGLVDDADFALSFAQSHGKQRVQDHLSAKDRSDVDVQMDFGPSAGLMVGSGLYDTNDDDDLFGDMNVKDFGSKGITDADFSFFDDHDFDRMGGGAQHVVEDMPDMMDSSGPEMQSAPVETITPEVSVPQKTPIEHASLPDMSPLQEDTPKSTQQEIPVHDTPVDPSSPDENNQTISPPLSPVEIKKILLPGPNGKDQTPPGHLQGQSYYNPVTFKRNVSNWDQKYGAAGKFWFTATDAGATREPTNSMGDIPTIGIPRRNRKFSAAEGISKAFDGQASPPSDEGAEPWQDSDSSSESSDESDSAVSERGASPATFSTRKRKRARSNSSSLAAQVKSLEEPDQESSVPTAGQSIFLGNFLSTFSDWSMTGYFSFPENQVLPVLARKDLQVQVAQILADQVTQSSLDHKLDGRGGISDLDDGAYSIRTFLEDTEFMDGMERLDLNGFISLQDNNQSSPPVNSANSRQALQRKETGKGSMSKLSPPHVRVRRGKEFLETLPPAVSFWETFGLEPAFGPKDIAAYCICPQNTTEAADAFLERIGLLYAGCNLGVHARGDKSNGLDQTLGSWNIESLDYLSAMQSLKVICEALGTALQNVPPSKDNIVIYMINPFTHAAAMVDLCSAFWALFQKYAADSEKQQTRVFNEVVLQIVPIDFISSTESLVVPPQVEYLSLALEVYSRCPPKNAQPSLVNCAPPMLLAEPLPRSLNFRLASEKPSPLQEGKCLHVACSRSQDQRWISVAWSDNTGSLQRTMSYNLRFRGGNSSRNVHDIRGEIWGATKDIMERISARWRLMVVHTGPVDQDEVDAWSNFVEQYNKTSTMPSELTVLNVNTAPELYLEPPFIPIPMSVFNAQTSSTPVATPNPSVLSPDQTGNAPTPPSGANAPTPTEATLEAESESLLTDICDESWGVILSHRLNSSPHLTEYRPALTSGYLLRRKGATDGDGLYALTVNLIYTQRHSSTHETLLREALGMYRDLATLARARGTCAVQRNTMPWHIATAIRAQELLSYVL